MTLARLLSRSALLACAAATSFGCAAAHLTGRPTPLPLPPPAAPRTVVVEPFFEDADWVQKTEAETTRVFTMYGGAQDVTMYRQFAEKPQYAQLAALAEEQKALIAELKKLRPDWKVSSTGDLPALSGPVTLVRVVLGRGEVVGSNRGLLQLAFGFGFLIPPLWLFEINPVTESQHLSATLQRIDANAADLRLRLLRYPTQPDFAVDTRGLPAQTIPVSTEFEYAEGLFASDLSRVPALASGVGERLAHTVVGVLDGPPIASAPPTSAGPVRHP